MTTTLLTPTEIRLRLRSLGYSPIPLNGKRPLMEGWQTKLETNFEEIQLWPKLYPYDTNTGIITRYVPLFDVDLLLEECAEAIEAMVRAECEERGELLTRIGLAPKRGLVFRTDEPFKKLLIDFQVPEGAKAQRLEFLGDGQQFVAYGVHPDTGEPYRWFARELMEVPREELPYIREADARALLEKATAIALDFGYRLKVDGEATGDGGAQPKPKPKPSEPRTFFQRVNTRALERIESWAKALFPKARYQKATGAWRVKSKDLGRDLEEDLSIAPEGIRDFGLERPYTAIGLVCEYRKLGPVPAAFWLCKRMGVKPEELGYVETGGLEDYVANDFSVLHVDRLRYVALWNKWLEWDGARWRFEDTLHAFDLARVLCRDAKDADHKTVAAVVALARTDRRQAATVEQWDANPWLLGTPGGTVDLRTGELMPARQSDYITKITSVIPASEPPAQSCQLWLVFLQRVTGGSQELQDYLQRVCGYCLTAITIEDAVFFHYGNGGNGKSVFLDTISGILNDYHEPADMEMFVVTHGEKHPTDLASLRGARLVTAVEVDEGRRWAESKLKQMTGGDPIKARFMRQDFFTYIPQFKPMFAGNHKPAIRNVDKAIN
jgi:hypothetical protein